MPCEIMLAHMLLSAERSLADARAGMELYPRIGPHFDIKTWTNCRMGMMGWGVLTLCWAAKQAERDGGLADSMLVSVTLMHLYIFKFFLYAARLHDIVLVILSLPACGKLLA